MVSDWEDAATPAAAAGIRTVQVRTGIVQTPRGGMLRLLSPLFEAGLGGLLGTGKQWLAWIALDDLLDIYLRAVLDPGLSGPVNAVAPEPVRNTDYTRTLAGVLRRPAVLPVPGFGPRLLLGDEGAREIAQASQYVRPERLVGAGHRFRQPELDRRAAASVRPRRHMTGRRIAVVGGGVSGMTAGYVLAQADHVTLFEADDRLGGHADTHPTGVDTGFIVYNERTYPLLTRLFAELGVATQPSQMSMSVRCAGCGLQYAGQRGLAGLAAGLPRGRGRYLRMLAEVPRFHRAARRVLDHGDPDGQVLADFLRTGGFSRYFTAHFALPLVAAVWSCPSGTALRYPARYLFAFLANHGMLSVSGSPPWRTVTGGSRRYVDWPPSGCPTSGCPRRSARCAATRITPRCATRPARRTGSTPWSSPPTRTRRCACSTRPRTPNATCSAPSPTPRTPPCCTPTSPCCPRRPSGRRGTTSSAAASRTTPRRASATT